MSEPAVIDLETESKPRYGTAAVVILSVIIIISVLLYGAVDTGTFALLSFLSFALVVYWAIVAWRTRAFPLDLNVVQLPVVALGVLGLIQLLPLRGEIPVAAALNIPASASLSLDPYSTRFFVMRLFLYVVFFAAALTFVKTIPRLRLFVVTLITFGALMAFYSILQAIEDPGSIYGLRQPAQALPFGTFINRHHFAALMEMTLGLSLGLLFAGDVNRNRWPFIGAGAVVMAISIILTGSRGGMIALVASLVAITAFTTYGRTGTHSQNQNNGFSPKLILAAAAVFLVFTIGIVLLLGGADPLLRGAGIGSGAGDFSSGRTEFWRTAFKIFLAHPIIGVGLDAFGTAYSSYDTTSGMFRVEQAHNDYLQILADAGIAGFACVAAFIFLLLKKGTATIRDSAPGFRRGAVVGALAGCVGIMVHSFFDFPLRTPANAFVFLALAAIAVVQLPEVKSKRRRRSRPDLPNGDRDVLLTAR